MKKTQYYQTTVFDKGDRFLVPAEKDIFICGYDSMEEVLEATRDGGEIRPYEGKSVFIENLPACDTMKLYNLTYREGMKYLVAIISREETDAL